MRSTVMAVIVAIVLFCPLLGAQPLSGVVDITSFVDHVRDPGTDMENWQPAFQQAIAVAQEEGKVLYVPAGEYKIR